MKTLWLTKSIRGKRRRLAKAAIRLAADLHLDSERDARVIFLTLCGLHFQDVSRVGFFREAADVALNGRKGSPYPDGCEIGSAG